MTSSETRQYWKRLNQIPLKKNPMDDFVLTDFNSEESYGHCVMVDLLIEEGLKEMQARNIANKWFGKPKTELRFPPYE